MLEATPVEPIVARYPYARPTGGDAGSSIQPHSVTRRADHVRREITETQQRLSKLQTRQRELIRQFPAPTGGTEHPEAARHAVHVRENGREIAAVEIELQVLEKRLSMAVDLDAEEGVSAGTDDFEGHLAAAMKHLQARGEFAPKLEQGFGLIREALQAYEAATKAASQHLHEAGRHLPKRQRMDLAHSVRRQITGSHSIHALVHALSSAGVGQVGIAGGVILDTASGQTPMETFESALAKCNNRIASHLDHWRKLARGEKRTSEPEMAPEPLPPAAPQEIKWADVTHFGAGGQHPDRRL